MKDEQELQESRKDEGKLQENMKGEEELQEEKLQKGRKSSSKRSESR